VGKGPKIRPLSLYEMGGRANSEKTHCKGLGGGSGKVGKKDRKAAEKAQREGKEVRV